MIARADDVFKQTYISKNSLLARENRHLEEKVQGLERALTKKENGKWIESLLNMSEEKGLKEKLYNLMMDKNSLDENYHKIQK